MENRRLWTLSDDAVVKLDSGRTFGATTFTLQDLKVKISSQTQMGLESPTLTGQVLEPGKYWRRGKFQLVLEFIPDETPPS